MMDAKGRARPARLRRALLRQLAVVDLDLDSMGSLALVVGVSISVVISGRAAVSDAAAAVAAEEGGAWEVENEPKGEGRPTRLSLALRRQLDDLILDGVLGSGSAATASASAVEAVSTGSGSI